MAYCTSAQVQAEFKEINFSASGASVNSTDVDRFIAEADAEIDSKLAQRYTVPITGATALIMVRMISIQMVAQRVRDILQVKTGRTEEDQDTRSDSRKIAIDMIEKIIKGEMKLPDATLGNSHQGVKGYNYANDLSPVFTKADDQW